LRPCAIFIFVRCILFPILFPILVLLLVLLLVLVLLVLVPVQGSLGTTVTHLIVITTIYATIARRRAVVIVLVALLLPEQLLTASVSRCLSQVISIMANCFQKCLIR